MSIKSVKVTMSSVGVNSVDKPRRVEYMPIANITYNEKGMQKKSVLLDNCMVKKDANTNFVADVGTDDSKIVEFFNLLLSKMKEYRETDLPE